MIFLFTVFTSVFAFLNLRSIPKNPKLSKTKVFGDVIYLLRVEGEIHSGNSTYTTTGAATMVSKLNELEERNEVKAIILEINSPGGTVGASQEIYNTLMRIRSKKKIIVSVKDIAASGGYYIASAANFIFALPGSITGSIGVITMSPNVSGLLQKLNVKMNVYKKGKYKDILSTFKDPTEEEKEIISSLLESTYNRFLEDVAKGRNLSLNEVKKFAEGKIFSGEEALKYKAIDGIGGRKEAQEKITELLELKEDLPIIEDEENPFDKIFEIINNKLDFFLYKETNKILKEIYRTPVLLIMPQSLRLEL
ncbi:MAG: signal peptide peptidase SppA [Leptospiraceae bacterium]|nr:signal peptide peptidase SppA [Leptospiraceae bacterium]